MIYVFPHYVNGEDEISKVKGISRLFAFPCKPHFENHGAVTILDSGAFAIHKSKNSYSMGKNYISRLNQHYQQYGSADNVICVAPDVLGDAQKTMRNFKDWMKNGYYPNISPVLQRDKQIPNMNLLKYQIEFYAETAQSKAILIPAGADGKTAKAIGFPAVTEYCKKYFDWVHVLGAGWTLDDVKQWKTIDSVDSIDCTNYYRPYNQQCFGNSDPIANIYKILEVLQD